MNYRYSVIAAVLISVILALANGGESQTMAAALDGSFDCAAVSEIPQGECEALVALYNSTDGENWVVNTDWLATSTPCSWFRVVCKEGHVTTLTLFSNNLSGPIPPELGNLTSLDALYLSTNQLTGSIPPELGNLGNLTRLFMVFNQLSGHIPAQLGNLTNLQDLSLVGNQLDGPIPPELGNLSKVDYLNLDNNELSGTLPSELGDLSSLTQLYVEGNPLNGPIPSTFTTLNLNALWFRNTAICVPDDPGFLNWMRTITSVKSTGFTCVEPALDINYASGAPGSYFTVDGTDFPLNSPVTISVNGRMLDASQTAADGTFSVLLATTDAGEGLYIVTATANPTVSIQFTLDASDPVRPQEGTGTIINVPAGIAFTEANFLPTIRGK